MTTRTRQAGTAAILRAALGAVTLTVTGAAVAATADYATSLAPGYQPVLRPANIAPTAATAARGAVLVNGQPRVSKGHPSTLWDQQDVAAIRERLKTNRALQNALAALRAAMDKRITEPAGVPDPASGAPTAATYRLHAANSCAIADLATLYALTGEEKYGEYARGLLVAYAENYARLPHPEGWTEKLYRSEKDGRLTNQFLEDGFWLIRAAFGYDLIYDLPSWTAEQRKLIRDDLFHAIARQFYAPVLGNTDYLKGLHNRSALCTAGVLMAGYASEDEKLINLGLYGVGGTAARPQGGVFGTYFTSQCIRPDGLWLEGAPGYQLGIVSCALTDIAETLWHHGFDLYRYQDGMLKRVLDSAIALAYPDERMTVAALRDSSRMALIDDRPWWNNEAGLPYECGWLRYGDPRYIPIVRNATQSLSLTVHAGPPSLFLELPADAGAAPRPVENANFFALGYGVLRLETAHGTNQLIMEYGPSGGHSHPSKLGIDLYALDDVVAPFPGVIFPYHHQLNAKWYWTTLANCALVIDEKSQIYFADRWKYPKEQPNPDAEQLVFGPARTMGMQRAWSATVHLGVAQDRSLFLTPEYLADLFGGFSTTPHQYDLAWHLRGRLETSLPLEPKRFSDPVANGYNALSDPRHASTDHAWSAAVTTPTGRPVRLLAGAGEGTEVITGAGHFFLQSGKEDEAPPTIIERRADRKSVIYGNAIDISGDPQGYLKEVRQEGGPDAGFGALRIETVTGTDLCFTSYRPGQYVVAGLETDAVQAMVRRNGAAVRAMYLAGGTTLKVDGGQIARSEPGLAYVEQLANGACVVANPSPTEATVSVRWPALAGLIGVVRDAEGRSLQPEVAVRASAEGVLSVRLKPGQMVELRRQ